MICRKESVWFRQIPLKVKEFAESMRNIMRNDEKNRKENNQMRDDNLDEDSRSLQEILEQKFDELFGSIDDEEE